MPEPTTYMSETSKYRHLTTPYCYISGSINPIPGAVLDIASQGDPVVPWAWQLDLPHAEFAYYNSNHPPRGPIQLRGHANKLPVDDESLDAVYGSHILEDSPKEEWLAMFKEWSRPIKHGGYLIILVPDKKLWNEALARGQTPNCSHRFEPAVGDMSYFAKQIGLEVIEDRLTNCFDGDYTILGVFKKL